MKPKKKNSRKPVPGGSYLAVCVYSIGIGEQLHKYADSSNYHDDVVIGFELCGFTYTEEGTGKVLPYDVSTTYTASMDERAKLRKHVEGWNGRKMTDEEADNFDTNSLVGRAAMLGIVLNENGFNNIASIQAIPDSILTMMPTPPQATMPLIQFDMEPWNQAAFEALPEWAKKRIIKSTEYQKNHTPTDTIQMPELNFQMPPQMPAMPNMPQMQTAVQQIQQTMQTPVSQPQQAEPQQQTVYVAQPQPQQPPAAGGCPI